MLEVLALYCIRLQCYNSTLEYGSRGKLGGSYSIRKVGVTTPQIERTRLGPSTTSTDLCRFTDFSYQSYRRHDYTMGVDVIVGPRGGLSIQFHSGHCFMQLLDWLNIVDPGKGECHYK